MDILKKVEEYLFYIFVFSVPFQIRVFVYEWGGPKDEFLSAFFYFTDALLLSIFVLWVIRGLKIKLDRYDFWLFGFVLISFLALFKISYTGFAYYQALKILEFIFLYFYIKSSTKQIDLSNTLYVFIFSGLFQSLLGIYQFLSQGNLGLKYIGETILSQDMAGIAKIDTENGKMIRSYGTFTHPNVLAAYLFFSIAFFYYLLIEKAKKFSWLDVFIFSSLVLGFFLTFSRSSFLVFFLFSLVIFLKYKKKSIIRKYVIFSAVLFLIFSAVFFSELSPRADIFSETENINLRLTYNSVAERFIEDNWLIGVGPGNFVNSFKDLDIFSEEMSFAYQPVHNVYLLIASEIGVIGFFAFLVFFAFLFKEFRKNIKNEDSDIVLLGLLFSVALLFLFDHYFWDLQQGRLILWFLFGVLMYRAGRKM